MIELVTHDSLEPGSLWSDWEALVDADPDAGLFHTPRYLRVWLEALGERAAPRIRGVYRDGRLVGVVPEAHERVGSPTGPAEVVRFLGGTEVTDYLGPIARREDRDDVAAAYLDAMAVDRDWDELVLGGLAEDTGWADAFRRHAERLELHVFEDTIEDVCPRIDLGGGFDGYLDRLPSKQRHEMRRKARKLARDAGEVRFIEVPPVALTSQLEVFFEMAAHTETEKARFFRKESMRGFFRSLAQQLQAERAMRLHILEVAGRPAAATVSLCWGREWGLYNSAFDPSLRSLAPGMVLVGELLEIAAREGYEVFDLLRGDEPYKYRFGAQDRPLERLIVVRR